MEGNGDVICENNARRAGSFSESRCFLSPIFSLTRLGVDMESQKVCPSFLFFNCFAKFNTIFLPNSTPSFHRHDSGLSIL